MSKSPKRVIFKKAIGAKTEAAAEEKTLKVYRDGHKFYTAPESKAIFETVTKENQLREYFYRNKIYLNRARNPLNGEYTPRRDDLPNISEVQSDEKQEWFSPEIPKADDSHYEKDKTKRQIERNIHLKLVRKNFDDRLQQLQQSYMDKCKDVEQSLLRNRLNAR